METKRNERERLQGYIVEADGMHAIVQSRTKEGSERGPENWVTGQLISLRAGKNRVCGMITHIESASGEWHKDEDNDVKIHVEYVGEVSDDENGNQQFSSGLSAYPPLGAKCHRIRHDDLSAIFKNEDGNVVSVGALSQNRDIPALVSIDNMISRHFAVVGTTGVGKSTAVTLLLRKIVDARPDVRVLIMDPHNEFEHALSERSINIDEDTLNLPFWLYTLEEIAEAVFNGRAPDPEEMELLREMIIAAKELYRSGGSNSALRVKSESQLTADTPLPYKVSDLIKLIEERRGTLDAKHERAYLRNLSTRVRALVDDPRYRFMFGASQVTDNLTEILSRIFRVPDEGRPIAIVQLAGIPSEIVNSTVSVLSRLAFDLAALSQSRIKTLLICEEAHRYIPENTGAGFLPTRRAISRIAKEGRKYGVHLGVITQRPSELDPTILSQCNTFFAMRLGNEVDQEIVRKAIPNGGTSIISFVPSLANREAIAFGQGASTAMRLKFEDVPRQLLPGNAALHEGAVNHQHADKACLMNAINLMRNSETRTKNRDADDEFAELCAETQMPQRETLVPAVPHSTNHQSPASVRYAGQNGAQRPHTELRAPAPVKEPARPIQTFKPAGPIHTQEDVTTPRERSAVATPASSQGNSLRQMMADKSEKRSNGKLFSSLLTKD
ncbi:MAG: DUF87 domain-containing protein [Pseudomonadota bacterium]